MDLLEKLDLKDWKCSHLSQDIWKIMLKWFIFIWKVGVCKASFCANSVWKVYHEFLFWKLRSNYKSGNCQFVAFNRMKRFGVCTHFYAASFSIKMFLKVRSHWTLFVILLTSAAICKQKFLHGNEIVQYLQNCKCKNVARDHSLEST